MGTTFFTILKTTPAEGHAVFVQNGDGQGDLYPADRYGQPMIERGALMSVRWDDESHRYRLLNRYGIEINTAPVIGAGDVPYAVMMAARGLRDGIDVAWAVRMIGDVVVGINRRDDLWIVRPYAVRDPDTGEFTTGTDVVINHPVTVTDRYPEHRVYVLADNETVIDTDR